jgi:histidine ammonia-lyase
VEALGAGTGALHAAVRRLVEPLVDERPLGEDVERVASALDELSAAARAAL